MTGSLEIVASVFNTFIGFSTTSNTIITGDGISPYVCDLSGIRTLLLHT